MSTDYFLNLLNTKGSYITLGANVTVTKQIVIPAGVEIFPGKYKFIQSGGSIIFNGYLNAGRRQVFQGFKPGEVIGSFGREVYPEWWGLEGEGPDTGKHDLAINCAAKAGFEGRIGIVVSLDQREYWVSAPIDFRGTGSRLRGMGSGQTYITATRAWKPTEWIGCDLFNHFHSDKYPLDKDMDIGAESSSSLVWIGSISPDGGRSFFYGIEGVSIRGWHAVRAHPKKRIHGISWTGWVEENSAIIDVAISQFSGIGIGGYTLDSIGTTNGVTIDRFWITKATRRGAIPIYVGNHAVVHSIRNGTIDCGVTEAETSGAYPITWPQFGVLSSGLHTVVDNLHIEGCCNAVHVIGNNHGSVSVTNIDVNHLMSKGMDYYAQSSKHPQGPVVATDSNLFDYSCILSIGKAINEPYMTTYNQTMALTIRNLVSQAWCKYLLRDKQYNRDIQTIGNGRDPNEEAAVLVNGDRAIPYSIATGEWPDLSRKWYNPTNPPTDKKYYETIV